VLARLARTFASVAELVPSMRSVKTMWLRDDCSFSAVQPTALKAWRR
jgi:hypothetical protein